jgi:hypothetical protein
MKLFAAIEKVLLERWEKIKVALKINKWPLFDMNEQRLQLKKQYLESLLKK